MSIEYIKSRVDSIRDGADSRVKSTMVDLFTALYDRQEQLHANLKHEVFDSLSKQKYNAPTIYTMLVPKALEYEYSNYGLEPMLNDGISNIALDSISGIDFEGIQGEKNVFLDTSYDAISLLCSKTFKATITKRDGKSLEVEYRFSFNRALVAVESLLYRLADTYNFDEPLVYSPYARKYMSVVLLDDTIDLNSVSIDLRARDNGLEGILLEDYSLLWNVSIDSGTYSITKTITPLYDDTLYKYTVPAIKPNDGNYLLVCNATPFDVRSISIGKDGLQLVLSKDISERKDLKVVTCTPLDTLQLKSLRELGYKVFCNQIRPLSLRRERLRTVADINYVVSAFSTSNVRLEYSTDKLPNSSVVRYPKALEYYSYVCDRLSMDNVRTVRITFSGKDEYMQDYVNYVLSYLEGRYPEFKWEGVVV